MADPALREYAAQRAAALGRRPSAKVDTCGATIGQEITCGCGTVDLVPIHCGGRWTCRRCGRRWAQRQKRRMAESLTCAAEDAREAWRRSGSRRGARPQVVLATLTVRHSGDLAQDRARIMRGWRAVYKALHRLLGGMEYCGCWEATPGRDGLGHVHLHVATIWPFVDWRYIRRVYCSAVGDPSAQIDLAAAHKGARGAAAYVAKYASKGVDLSSWPPLLAGELVGAMYGKRGVQSSHRFWRRRGTPCRHCGEACRRYQPSWRERWEGWERPERPDWDLFTGAVVPRQEALPGALEPPGGGR